MNFHHISQNATLETGTLGEKTAFFSFPWQRGIQPSGGIQLHQQPHCFSASLYRVGVGFREWLNSHNVFDGCVSLISKTAIIRRVPGIYIYIYVFGDTYFYNRRVGVEIFVVTAHG